MKQKSLEVFIPSSSGRIEGRYFKNQKAGSPIAIIYIRILNMEEQ